MAQPRHGGRVRIIGGQWRRRQLRFDAKTGVRPTPDAVRETLFNWLGDAIVRSTCLDLFAGSGALGFEAASRGAARVVMVEHDPRCLEALRENHRLLGAENVELILADARRFLQRTSERFDIVFVDPPFNRDLVPAACALLRRYDRLTAGALVYVEAERDLSLLPVAAGWQVLRSKTAGAVAYHLLRCGPAVSTPA